MIKLYTPVSIFLADVTFQLCMADFFDSNHQQLLEKVTFAGTPLKLSSLSEIIWILSAPPSFSHDLNGNAVLNLFAVKLVRSGDTTCDRKSKMNLPTIKPETLTTYYQ